MTAAVVLAVMLAPVPDAKVVYKTTPQGPLKLHVFRPTDWRAGDRRPALVFFFGGGWIGGTPTQFYPQARYLADRGMVACCAEYRVRSRHGTRPAECVRDGNSAVRYLRRHAAELGIDPDRIAAGGGSAGGQVAAATALCDGFDEPAEDAAVSSDPNALVLYNPVVHNGPGGWGHDRVKDHWRQISPLHNVDADAPPTILFLGTADRLIPATVAQEYGRRMEDAGRRCELKFYTGRGHGFFNRRDGKPNPDHDLTTAQTHRFLASLEYLEPDDSLPEGPGDELKDQPGLPRAEDDAAIDSLSAECS